MNVNVVETEKSFAAADFCRPKTEAEIAAAKKHCMGYQTDMVVCYCTGCVKGVQTSGVQGIHLMDLIMGEHE